MRRGPRARKGPAVAAGILLALLALLGAKEIMVLGLTDQAVQSRAGVAAHWLRPTDSRAAALAAGEMLEAGDVAAAERLARRALTASPMDVVAIRTLASVYNRREPGSGDRLMVIAGSLGWRDRLTQLWLVERALVAGEIEIAFARAEALIRVQRDRQIAFSLYRVIAREPRGSALILRSLAARPFWREEFFAAANAAPENQLLSMASLLDSLRRTPAPPTMAEARATIDSLFDQGRAEMAFRLYSELAPGRRGGALVSNGDFQDMDIDYVQGAASTVFDWRVFQVDGSSASVEATSGDGGNRALFGLADGNTSHRIAQQVLMLSPGTYQLAYRMRSEQASAPEVLNLGVRCNGSSASLSPRQVQPLAGDGWETRTVRFTVPADGCRAQTLYLAPSPGGDGSEMQAYFDDVSISRVR